MHMWDSDFITNCHKNGSTISDGWNFPGLWFLWTYLTTYLVNYITIPATFGWGINTPLRHLALNYSSSSCLHTWLSGSRYVFNRSCLLSSRSYCSSCLKNCSRRFLNIWFTMRDNCTNPMWLTDLPFKTLWLTDLLFKTSFSLADPVHPVWRIVLEGFWTCG